MKYFALILLTLCLAVTSITAQRLDEHKFTHQYQQLPKEPLAGDFKTYDVRINNGTLNLAKMGMLEASMIKSYFSLTNYTYQQGAGDFMLEINLDGDFFVSKEAKKKQKKQGSGDDAKTVTYYEYEVKYRIPVTYRILDGKRDVMVDKIFSGYDRHYTKTFGEASSIARLEAAWENKGDATLDTWVKADFRTLMTALQGHLQSLYDTRPATQTPIFYGIKKADKIGYEDFAAAVPNLKSVVEGATVEAPLTMADFGENITLWQAALESADATDKKEGVAFQAAAYNLAWAALLTGDYDQARAMATRLAEADRRDWLTRAIMPIIEDREQRFVINQNVAKTYHSTFDEASHTAYLGQQNATAGTVTGDDPTSDPTGFVVLNNQDTLHGIISYSYKEIGNDGLKNLKGVYVEDQTSTDRTRRYLEVEEFIYLKRGGVTYFPVAISFGPLSLMTLQEPLYGTEGLILNRLEDDEGEYSYWLVHAAENRKGDTVKKVYPLDDGLLMNLNKSLANKFEGYCPGIVAKALEEAYDANGTSYREIIDDYAKCNGTETFER